MTTSAPPRTALSRRDDTTDAQLLARTARGDESGFRALHDRHARACARRARRVLASEEWVEDVVQSVFLDLWRQAHRFDGDRGSARSWLLAVTHHKAVDLVRAQERHAARRASEQLLQDRVDAAPTPEQAALTADAAERLRAAVGRIRSPHREVVQLCFLDGLTQQQAAARLSVPLGTVKTRSRSGLLELRAILATSP